MQQEMNQMMAIILAIIANMSNFHMPPFSALGEVNQEGGSERDEEDLRKN